MTSPISLPEEFKIVNVAYTQVGDGVTYDRISCKNAHKVWFLITQMYGGDTDITFSLTEATAVSGGSTSAVTKALPIWYDIDVTAATTGAAATTLIDAMTKITSGSSHQMNTGANKHQMCVIEWDPAKHTAGYDCIEITDAGGHNSSRVTAIAIIQTRYKQAVPPSAVVN